MIVVVVIAKAVEDSASTDVAGIVVVTEMEVDTVDVVAVDWNVVVSANVLVEVDALVGAVVDEVWVVDVDSIEDAGAIVVVESVDVLTVVVADVVEVVDDVDAAVVVIVVVVGVVDITVVGKEVDEVDVVDATVVESINVSMVVDTNVVSTVEVIGSVCDAIIGVVKSTARNNSANIEINE